MDRHLSLFLAGILIIGSALAAPSGDGFDWDKARKIFRKSKNGQKLTDEEQTYLKKAKELRMKQRSNMKPKQSIGLKPLTEMGKKDSYKEQDGGLYGNGQNTPPMAHQKTIDRALSGIAPLDGAGKPSDDGKIVFISIGMSNTSMEFSTFVELANADSDKAPSLVVINGAQGGRAADDWADTDEPWQVLQERLTEAGVNAQQVQVAWMKHAERMPSRLGEFPGHTAVLQEHSETTLVRLHKTFPNLRLVYLSSRTYAGYATQPLNPEPYAYESAFCVRWLIQDQIKGKPELNCDPDKGKVSSPVILWGPYLWTDGITPRESDNFVYKRTDLAGDGTHPSPQGRKKIAELMLEFFKTDKNAKRWFLD